MADSTPPIQTQTLPPARGIDRIVTGVPTSDGAGVRLTRVLTQDLQRRLDPFLMLDAFGSDNPDEYIAGFPDHPHRGFETVTYMIAGRMRHRDSAGHEGLLQNGGVQWMTAGRGVIHSELPEQEEGRMEGFQLWLNLPARDKMCAPWYRDIQAHEVPSFTTAAGVTVRVIAGQARSPDAPGGLDQPVAGAVQREGTQPLYLDLELPAGSRYEQWLDAAHNGFVYTYRGAVEVAGTRLSEARMGLLVNGTRAARVVLEAPADLAAPARALLIAGRPLREPLVQYGPFVMNHPHELVQAVHDFQTGRLA